MEFEIDYSVPPFPKVALCQLPTPLEKGPELPNNSRLWIKRDDLTGFSFGGNKTRKIEYLLADILIQDKKTVVTIGAAQSNHARCVAAACDLAGLKCILVLSKDKTAGGNLYLSKLYGAEVIQVEGDVKALEKIALDICSNVKDAYYITYGGSNIIGAVSYAFCFSELMNQANSRNIGLSHIFLPVSSMGTLAGLLAGRALYAHKLREAQTYKSVPKIVGASVNPGHVNKDFVIELCKEVISGLKTDKNVPIGDFELSLEFAGKSYALPTRESLDAFLWTKAHCGFLLDHVYGAKAFAALLHYINENLIAPGKNVCYIHTGGAPSLFGYAIL